MIEELTEQKLIEYGFPEDTIKKLLKPENYSGAKLSNNLGHYYASPDEKKIYSGDDYFLKTGDYMMFPFDNFDMVPAYYELNLKVFLTKKKKQYGIGYNEADEIVYYKEEEIKGAKLITSHGAIFYTPAYVEISIRYIAWLTRKIEEPIKTITTEDYKKTVIDNTLPPIADVKQGKTPAEPTSTDFKDLFINPELIKECLSLLIEEGAISDNYEFIKNKGLLIIWLNVLVARSMFKNHLGNDINKVKILEDNFKNLKVSASLFRAKNIRATGTHKKYFEQAIIALKR